MNNVAMIIIIERAHYNVQLITLNNEYNAVLDTINPFNMEI